MIKPLGERVLVEAIEQETTTSFGIVLPDSAKEKPQEGKIIAVGAGALKDGARIPLEVKKATVSFSLNTLERKSNMKVKNI